MVVSKELGQIDISINTFYNNYLDTPLWLSEPKLSSFVWIILQNDKRKLSSYLKINFSMSNILTLRKKNNSQDDSWKNPNDTHQDPFWYCLLIIIYIPAKNTMATHTLNTATNARSKQRKTFQNTLQLFAGCMEL